MLCVAVIKRDFLSAGLPTFSGGKHAVQCAARSLAKAGHDVTVLCEATPAQVMLSFVAEAGTGMCLPGLGAAPERLCPEGGTSAFCVVRDYDAAGAVRLRSQGLTVVACEPSSENDSAVGIAMREARPELILMDADELYVANGGDRARDHTPTFPCIARRTVDVPVLVLIQNVHFLPFGPAGCGAAREEVMHVWRSAAAFACVSRFVAEYVTRWCPEAIRSNAPILTVSLNAFGVFGDGPFLDIGSRVLHRMTQPHPRPVALMPKLSDVKGAQIFFALAARCPEVSFVGVTGDPSDAQWKRAAVLEQSNVRIRGPGAVDDILEEAWVMLCPSLWLEAFGMVVVDGLTRGIPVLASSVGGLPEAKLGTGYLLPVQPIHFRATSAQTVSCGGCRRGHSEPAATTSPLCEDAGGKGSEREACSAPKWADRVLPGQAIEPWVSALRRVLQVDAYREESESSRSRAVQYVSEGAGALSTFCTALRQLRQPNSVSK